MTPKSFEELFDEIVKQERETLCKKKREYADGESRFINFYDGAHFTGLTPEQTLWCYMAKHLASIREIVNGKTVTREVLREKIGDARNYLILLEGMISDKLIQDGVKNISKEMFCQYEVNP